MYGRISHRLPLHNRLAAHISHPFAAFSQLLRRIIVTVMLRFFTCWFCLPAVPEADEHAVQCAWMPVYWCLDCDGDSSVSMSVLPVCEYSDGRFGGAGRFVCKWFHSPVILPIPTHQQRFGNVIPSAHKIYILHLPAELYHIYPCFYLVRYVSLVFSTVMWLHCSWRFCPFVRCCCGDLILTDSIAFYAFGYHTIVTLQLDSYVVL